MEREGDVGCRRGAKTKRLPRWSAQRVVRSARETESRRISAGNERERECKERNTAMRTTLESLLHNMPGVLSRFELSRSRHTRPDRQSSLIRRRRMRRTPQHATRRVSRRTLRRGVGRRRGLGRRDVSRAIRFCAPSATLDTTRRFGHLPGNIGNADALPRTSPKTSLNHSIERPCTTTHRIKKELSICQSFRCLGLVRFPVLSQIKPQAPLLVVPFRQFL
ncbi:hypothetical protein PUN28_020544 [Cardiocondyla obscurior]|uniref:Uncharacterized protein n=1 Tax=Cardiocondyla obscurior TaxID=286306 RepID=A0AAW2E793_9HYME